MKTGEVSVGHLGNKKHYTIIQDDTMLVTAYEVDKASGALSNYSIRLGKLRPVEDPQIQELILNKLNAHSS